MKTQDKKAIAKQVFDTSFIYLDTWLKCLTILRNKCAHYSRLYNTRFIVRPKLNLSINKNPYLFEQLIVLKNLYTNATTWNNNFLISLESLLEEYSKYIRFMDIGFPDNWKEIYSSWKAGKITAKTAMEMTNTKRTSFYKLVRMTEENT